MHLEANKYKKLTGKAPRGWRTFTYKSGASELRLNKENKAKKYFEEIKEDYPDSQQAINIDIKLSQVN